MQCKNCGNVALTEAAVSTCPKCAHEEHDYDLINNLRIELATYQSAFRRVNRLLNPDTNTNIIKGTREYLVTAQSVHEALLLEPELFPAAPKEAIREQGY